ncbi:MAG: PA14 domain-containing protein [Janthinobacterium lividum]
MFKKGDVWTGATLETKCNGLTFGNYGSGELPVIDGSTSLAINISRDFRLDQTIDGIAFKRTGAKDIVAQLGNVWFDFDLGIVNCRIKNCYFYGSVTLQGSYNFFENNIVDGATNNGSGNGIWEYDKQCHNNTYTGNTVSNFTLRGIWTMIRTHESVFENNTVYNCDVAGIDLDGAYHLVYGHTIKNNKVYNNKLNGIAVENAFDCTIQGNNMYGGGHSYIYVINYEQGEVMDGHGAVNCVGAILNTTISGNIMIGGGTDFTSVAINIYKAGGVNVSNNSIYNFKSRFFNLDYSSASEVQMIKLVNNVFSTIESPSWYAMVNFSTNENVLAEDDYNCFYNNGLNDIYTDRNTGNQKSLSQYKAATGKGLHSISVNPLFADKNDLHLQNTSPCIDAGKNVGSTFSGKAPDMGAYEYLSDAVVNSMIAATACSATGTILREEWDNIYGNTISNIPLQTTPTSTSQLIAFESPVNIGNDYGTRIRGYICPPQTGSYTFWVAGDDATELWLSTDDNPANKVRIAQSDAFTDYREWSKYPSQKSNAITLEAGKKYYIEALQKDGGGNDNLSVQWQLPDATMETPIAGSHLSPYVNTTAIVVATGTGAITRDEWDNVSGASISDIPLQKAVSSSSEITSFEGPLNPADNYASRIRGYIYPPQTGNYTFWLATDDAGELWLSADDQSANKVRIANVNGWTNFREWNKYISQQSAVITLQAGKKYYIEALQKENSGNDNLSVQWQLPDATMETPIAGSHLSPYVAEQLNTSSLNAYFENGSISPLAATATEQISATVKTGLYVYPNPVSRQTTVEFAMPEAGQTDIALYNTKGQLINKLFTGTTEANVKQSLVLSAENLQNGVYIIHLRSGKNNLTKKVFVIK